MMGLRHGAIMGGDNGVVVAHGRVGERREGLRGRELKGYS